MCDPLGSNEMCDPDKINVYIIGFNLVLMAVFL